MLQRLLAAILACSCGATLSILTFNVTHSLSPAVVTISWELESPKSLQVGAAVLIDGHVIHRGAGVVSTIEITGELGQRSWRVGLLPLLAGFGDFKLLKEDNFTLPIQTIDDVRILEPPKRRIEKNGIIRFSPCGGIFNKIYSLTSLIGIAAHFGATLQFPDYIWDRPAYDPESHGVNMFSRILDVEGFSRVVRETYGIQTHDLAREADVREAKVTLNARMQQLSLSDWEGIIGPSLRQGEIVDLECTYFALCPGPNTSHCCFEERTDALSTSNISRILIQNLKPHTFIEGIALKIVSLLTNNGERYFNALHLRYEPDWNLSKKDKSRSCFVDPFEAFQNIFNSNLSESFKSMPLFLLGGFTTEMIESIAALDSSIRLVTKHDFPEVSEMVSQLKTFDELAWVDHLVGRSAKFFVGNECSTFSAASLLWRLTENIGDTFFFYNRKTVSVEDQCFHTVVGIREHTLTNLGTLPPRLQI